MNNPWVIIARYILVGAIWAGVLLFEIALAQTSSLGENSGGIALGIAALICAAVATGFVFSPNEHSGDSKELKAGKDASKQKNEQRSLDPASLLTDEDLEELRQAVKDNFRRRLLQGEDVTSFEALLGEQDQRMRR